jgi:hypothetical protein
VGVVVGRPDAAGNGQRPDAGQPVIKAADEGHAAHLAVRDHVDAGLHLIAHGDADRVVVALLEVHRPQPARRCRLAHEMEPGGKPMAAADGGGDERQGAESHGHLKVTSYSSRW